MATATLGTVPADVTPAAAPPAGDPPPRRRPARRFRAHLLRLVLAVTLPLALLGAGQAIWTADARRDEALRAVEATARALQLSLDRELTRTIAMLEALARSPALDEALAGGAAVAPFHAQATAVVAARAGALATIWLMPAETAAPVMNTLVPPGRPVPTLGTAIYPERPLGPPPEPERALRALVEQGVPAVGDLARGPVVGWVIPIGLPVRRDGRVVAVLAAGLRPESLSQVMQDGMQPGIGTATLVDRGGVVVARTVDPGRFVGTPAPPAVLAMMREPSVTASSLATTSLEGLPMRAVLRRLSAVPFVVGYGAPQELVDIPFRQALALSLGLGLAALLLAVGAAIWLGRQLGAEVAALGADVLPLTRGEPPPVRPPPRIAEVAAARSALARAASSLADSEARFTRTVAAGRMGTWEWDARNNRLTGSAGREALYGRPPGSLPTREALIAVAHPDDRAAVDAAANAALAGHADGLYDVEFRAVWPDGTVRWLHSQGRAEFEPDGRPRRISGVVVDVTERRLAEDALRDSERRLRLAQDAAGIGAWERDLRTGQATWSDQEYRLHGLEPDGPPPSAEALHAMMLPEFRGRGLLFEQLRDGTATLDQEGRTAQLEYAIRRADTGVVRWLQVQGRILPGPDGRPARIVGVSLDVTERRAAEEQRELLMREVDHRAKNALAVALSVVQLAPRDVPPEAFAASVTSRIAAMARTHSLLAAERWAGAEIGALARAELAAHEGHFTLEGPRLRLTAEAAQPVAMLLHELATNAAKHGALSTPGGRVELGWSLSPAEELLRLHWQERGGPPLDGPPRRAGFGSRLLTALAKRQLGGSVEVDWSGPAGVAVTLRLPARHVAAVEAGFTPREARA
jgi:PAS domain S-box-containing protein